MKYGQTRDSVLGLEVVLADGRVIRTGGKNVKDVAGYALTHLFVGSQGTLGIITEATLRLRVAPPPRSTMLAFFPTLDGAGDAVAGIVAAGHRPGDARADGPVHDRRGRRRIQLGLDREAAAMLLVESDLAEPRRGRGARRAVRACEAAGATTTIRPQDADRGRLAPPGTAGRAPGAGADRRGPDGGRRRAPQSRAGPAPGDRGDRHEHDIRIATFGHAGDGNLHPNFIFEHGDPRAEELTEAVRADLYRAAIELGGTVTGEHGIGSARREWLVEQVGADAVRRHARDQDGAGPAGMLNPGRVLPPHDPVARRGRPSE